MLRLAKLACVGLAAWLFLVPVSSALRAADDLLIANFEATDYGDWKTTGQAFASGPAKGTLPGQMPVSGFQGAGLVNSFHGGDSATGTLTSPPFKIERKYLQFLLGGGNHPGETCVNLLVDGKPVRSACHDGSDGSEHLETRAWDVADLAGKQVVIEIVDRHTGGWGHVNVDQFVQTDRKLPGWQENPTRELTIEKRFLHFPIKNGVSKRRMQIMPDAPNPDPNPKNINSERFFDIELADSDPDWWAFCDMQSYLGRKVTLTVDRLREDSHALEQVVQSNDVPGAAEMYQETLRPQFHFSARRGWLNDPNGLVYHDGEYHLFFQHNPYGWNWGNMHWGHATSRDLVHWREHPEALYPDELGTMFSGSAVVDTRNTAGFQTGSPPPIVLIYTAAGGKQFTQCLAFSNDAGKTWTKYSGNPVLTQLAGGNRDPKVFWHEPTGKWVMALYLDKDAFAIFTSADLKQWDKTDDVRIPGTIECPELFPIAVEGEPNESRWIFYGANGGYLVGQFDGRKFTRESGPHTLHQGNCFYASQTYNNLPPADGRRVLIPWGQVALPGMPFNQMMGLPVELRLRSTPQGKRLTAWPVKELESLRTKTDRLEIQSLSPGEDPLFQFTADLCEVQVELSMNSAQQVALTLRGIELVCDAQRKVLTCLGKRVPLPEKDGRIRLRVFVDRTSVDVFAGQGEVYMPLGTLVPSNDRALSIIAHGGTAVIESLELHELAPAWTRGKSADR